MAYTQGLQFSGATPIRAQRFRGRTDDYGYEYGGRYYSDDAWDTHILAGQKSRLQQTLLIQHLDKPILQVADKPVTTLALLKAIQDNTKPRLGDRLCGILSELTGGLAGKLSAKIAKKAQKAYGADVADIAKSLGIKWAPLVDYERHIIVPNLDVTSSFVPPDSEHWKKHDFNPNTAITTYVPELGPGEKNAYRIELSPLEQALRVLSDSAIVSKSPESSYFNGYSLNHFYGLTDLGRKALAKPEKLKQKFPLTVDVTTIGV